ncbi:MAG: heme-binding protein [Burkholderiales bacterium]|nr:heme-binding protein [Pseudomonadota bacterium]
MKRILTLVATSFCLAASSSFAAELASRMALTLDVAKQLSAAAEAEAAKNNWTVAIAIVDEAGHLVHLAKIDNTQYGSIDVAIQKAQTSAAFKRPTKVFEEAIAGGRNAIIGLKGALPLEGGLPIIHDGKVIGAIGVSGVKSTEDGQVAKAGADALARVLGK